MTSPGAVVGGGQELSVQLGLGPDVDAVGRFVEQEDERGAAQPLPEEDLLLVPAAERREALADSVDRTHAEPLEPRPRLADLLATPQAQPCQNGLRSVMTTFSRAVNSMMAPWILRSGGR